MTKGLPKSKTKNPKQSKSVITAFKGFDKDLKCRGMQFEIGKTYHTEKHPVRCGDSGFHACDNPFDAFDYYSMDGQNRFALVEASGEICRKGANDTKFAAATLTIKAELQMPAFFKACADYIWNIVDPSKLKITHQSDAVISKKNYDKIGTSGDGTQIGTSGNWTKIGTSGNGTKIGTSGNWTQIGTSGNWTKIGTSGYGTQIELNGEHGVLACVHAASKIKASLGTLVCLVHFAYDKKTPLKFVTGKIGEEGLKPHIWYTLDENGEFMEVDA